jgi:uncharacterized protein involved in outer membrane biogenesis
MLIFKRTLIALVTLMALAIGGVAALVMTIDPNRVTPLLQSRASAAGYQLEVGHIDWRFWPALALEVEDVLVSETGHAGPPLVRADRISLTVAVRSLLQRDIRIISIDLDRTDIHLDLDRLPGKDDTKWAGASSAPSGDNPSPHKKTAREPLTLAIEQLSIQQGRMQLMRAGKPVLNLDQLDLALRQFALKAASPSLQFNGIATLPQQPARHLTLKASWDQNDTLDQLTFSQLNLSEDHLKLDVALHPANLRRAEAGWQLKAALTAVLDGIDIRGPLRLKTSGKRPSLHARLTGGHWDLRPWITAAPAAPPREAKKASQASRAVPPANPGTYPLPVEALQQADVDLTLELDKLTLRDQTLDKPRLAMTGQAGLVNISTLRADWLGGQFTASGHLDARKLPVSAHGQADFTDVDLKALRQVVPDIGKLGLTGQGQIQTRFSSRGRTAQALQDNLVVNMQLSGRQLALSPFNLNQTLCQVAALTEQKPMHSADWLPETRLLGLDTKMVLKGQQLEILSLDGGMENLGINGHGLLDLAGQTLDLKLDLKILGEGKGACVLRNDRLRNRPLPLRCKGPLDGLGLGSCMPDRQGVLSLLQQEALHQAGKRYGDELDNVLEDTLGEDAAQPIKDILKGLF